MSLADQQWCPTNVQVTVHQARGLRIKGKSGTNDAYAVMQVGKEKYQTSVVEKSVAPVWKEEAAFDLPPLHQGGGGERCTLHVHVMHRALVGPDKLLGQAVINLLQLSEDKTRDKTEWFKLLDKTGKSDKDRGEVLVDIQFMRNNMTASMFDISAAGKSRSRLGKFKDKVRGKKKESDSVSAIVPSFTQVLTDSEEEGNGGGEVAAGKDEKKKKLKMKSLFSHKSNLQKNMSQSMSVLPVKNSSLSGSQSSGLNVDSSEGKKKFKFMIHKRSGSSDSKESTAGQQKHGSVEQSNLCINGSHVYCEEPQSRTTRIGSNFSLASSGHGSMEDVPESSPPSVDSLRAVRQYSPWTEEEEEAEVENKREDMEDMRIKEEEEEMVRRQELERLAEEKRLEEEERMRIEEEKHRREEDKRIRREEERAEEEERVRREEEEHEKLAEEKRLEQERMRVEEEKNRREEEERIRMEEERAQEERRRKEKEEEEERVRRQEEEREKLAKEKRRLEEEERKRIEEEKARKKEEERIRREEERAQEENRRQEEEERVRRQEEHEEKRRLEEEEERIRKEEERRQEEEEKARKEKEEYERLVEEKRKLEEEERKRIEENIRREEEQRKRIEEAERVRRQEEEQRRVEEEEKRQMEEEENIRKEEDRRRQEEEEMARKEKEEYERLVEEKRKLEEEEERKRKEEEDRFRMEEQERIRMEEERAEEERQRRQVEEERARKEKEEMERLAEERRLAEQEKRRIEEEEKMRREEEERIRMQEKAEKERKEEEARELEKGDADGQEKRENQTKDGHRAAGKSSKVAVESRSPAEVTSTNPFEENFSSNPFDESPNSPAGPDSSTAKVSSVQQRCQSPEPSVGSTAVSTDEKNVIGTQREKRHAPQPPGRNQAKRHSQREPDASTQHLAQINKPSKEKDAKTASVLPQRSLQMKAPLSRSPTDTKNNQSLTQSSTTKGTTTAAKHTKRPAPSRPRSVEEEPFPEPKTSHGCGSEAKQVPVVYGLNPFDDDDDENELTAQDDITASGNTGSIVWPPAVSQAHDQDDVSQTKIKSSKIAHAPPPPAKTAATSSTLNKQNTDRARVTDETVPGNNATQTCDPEPEAIRSVPFQESPLHESQPVTVQRAGEEAGGKKEGPHATSRRLQPVKPLNPLKQQSVSAIQGGKDNKSTGILCEVQENTKVNDTGVKGPYSQLTQRELISLVLKQENQLSERDRKISELELYIDNLIVRVIEEKPSILMSMNSLKKTV